MFRNHLTHQSLNCPRSYVTGHMKTMSLPRVFINNTQDSATAPFESPLMDEIPYTKMSWIRCLLRMTPCRLPQTPLVLLGWRNDQPLLATNLTDSIIADTQLLVVHQSSDFLSPPVWILVAEPDNGLLQDISVWGWELCLIPEGRSIELKEAADLPLL